MLSYVSLASLSFPTSPALFFLPLLSPVTGPVLMSRAPFLTGRGYENGHETSVEPTTLTVFGSLVDSYGTGFYLRSESGIKVFRNRNVPTTGLVCGASVSGGR